MRPISDVHLQARDATPSGPRAASAHNKWALFRELATAKAAFSLSERDLTVLQGLLSFFPSDTLSSQLEMIVFPSNRAICDRLNGMADSTMRRHLANLISSGVILRRDSPNGKRYSRNDRLSRVTFGFDLSPLANRSDEIITAATEARRQTEETKRLRETISLMRRDLIALTARASTSQPQLLLWSEIESLITDIGHTWRRKLSFEQLLALKQQLSLSLEKVERTLAVVRTDDLDTSAVQNEQHYHNTNKKCLESESCQTNENHETLGHQASPVTRSCSERTPTSGSPEPKGASELPLHVVTKNCPTVQSFSEHTIQTWQHLYNAASSLRAFMGINQSTWEEAQRCMGQLQASVVIAAMLERFSKIRSPGAYLRTLSAKAKSSKFSCVPMITALGRLNSC